MKTYKLLKSAVLISCFAIVLFASSCSFYKVVPIQEYTSSSISKYDSSGKYLVLKRGDNAWHMYNVQIHDDSITAKLDIQLGNNVNHINPKTNGLNQFRRKEEPEVEYTVHLFTNDSSFSTFDSVITIHESSIFKIDKFEYARAPSRAAKIVPIVMAPVLVLVLFTIDASTHPNEFKIGY